MQKLTDTATVKEFQGETLPEPVKFEYEFVKYENRAEAEAAQMWLTEGDILNQVNANAKVSGRQKKYNEVMADYIKAYKETDAFKLKNLIASIKLQHPKWSDEKVAQFAASIQAAE